MATHKTLGAVFTFNSVACPNVQDVSVDGVQVNEKKLSIITDQWNKYVGTSSEPGSIKVKAFYDITGYTALTALLGAPANHAWTLVYDTTQSISGNGFLKSFSVGDINQEGYASCDLEIKNDGAVTFTGS